MYHTSLAYVCEVHVCATCYIPLVNACLKARYAQSLTGRSNPSMCYLYVFQQGIQPPSVNNPLLLHLAVTLKFGPSQHLAFAVLPEAILLSRSCDLAKRRCLGRVKATCHWKLFANQEKWCDMGVAQSLLVNPCWHRKMGG
jgi:hypothetical protein